VLNPIETDSSKCGRAAVLAPVYRFSQRFFFCLWARCVECCNKDSTRIRQRFNKGSKGIAVSGIRTRQIAQAIYSSTARDSGCKLLQEITSQEMSGVARGSRQG
jgi:hypothetical protein